MTIQEQKKKLQWDDDPRIGHYIDDNALYVLNNISRGRFVASSTSYRFFFESCKPFEWKHKTMIKFLIRASEEYGIELKNFETMTYAFAEEYEQPIFDEKTGKLSAGPSKKHGKNTARNIKNMRNSRKNITWGPMNYSQRAICPPFNLKNTAGRISGLLKR